MLLKNISACVATFTSSLSIHSAVATIRIRCHGHLSRFQKYCILNPFPTMTGASLIDATIELDDGSKLLVDKTETGLSNFAITSGSYILLKGLIDYDVSSRSIMSQDALDAIRLSVGMDTQNGSKTDVDYIETDFNKDGKESSQDALAILKNAVVLSTTEQAEWVLVDSDYSDISRTNANYDDSISIADLASAIELGLTSILIGDVNDSYSGLFICSEIQGTRYQSILRM